MAELVKAFIAICQDLRRQTDWAERIRDAMHDLLSKEGLAEEMCDELDPEFGGKMKVYIQSADLTIYSILSDGGVRGPPHDHAVAAVVGLVTGSEQYKIYSVAGDQICETGLQRVVAPDVALLSDDLVHAMWNARDGGGLSLHVYGNSHIDVSERRQWNPYTLACGSFDWQRQLQWTMELTAQVRGASQ